VKVRGSADGDKMVTVIPIIDRKIRQEPSFVVSEAGADRAPLTNNCGDTFTQEAFNFTNALLKGQRDKQKDSEPIS